MRSARPRHTGPVRIYLPSTLPLLRSALADGQLAAGVAFAVTPELRESYRDGELEELEYVALTEAARASLRLLEADPAAARRRVVLAADVPDTAIRPAPEQARAAVRVDAPVSTERVVCAHVDDIAAEKVTAQAADNIIAADLGSADAQFAVDEAKGFELLWYAAQEIGPLLESC